LNAYYIHTIVKSHCPKLGMTVSKIGKEIENMDTSWTPRENWWTKIPSAKRISNTVVGKFYELNKKQKIFILYNWYLKEKVKMDN
jgi:hypothetical protein